jgi:hypothetical protein
MPNHDPTPAERDERISLPLDPEEALKALMKVDPTSAAVPGLCDDENCFNGADVPCGACSKSFCHGHINSHMENAHGMPRLT